MMITAEWARHMARYNRWQNRSLMAAADGLEPEALTLDRGAFWGSIAGTFNHLLWGDTIWMARFDGGESVPAETRKTGVYAYGWAAFKPCRTAMDQRILDWTAGINDADMQGVLSWYSGAVGRDMEMPRVICIMQLFNHQTHHRGQIHAMLTAAGARPEDTDIPFMPQED